MIRQTYFLDAASLTDATTIYLDQGLTVFAPDGYYSDGIITRELVSNVLLPQQECVSCAISCPIFPTLSTSSTGVYELNISSSDSLGAIIIRFSSNYGEINGLRVTLNSIVYNKVVSPLDGGHQSTNSSNYTFFGVDTCSISGVTYTDLPLFVFDGTSLIYTPPDKTIYVAPGDVSASVTNPGNIMMVIPKTFSGSMIMNISLASVCYNEQEFNFTVVCPTLLTPFASSSVAVSSASCCALSETQSYYNASLAGTPGTVGLYDFVFSDVYGLTPLTAGFYRASGSIVGFNDWFEVDALGVVVSLGVCSGAAVYEGTVWFGFDPMTGIDACDVGSPTEYLYWATQQLFYSGLVFYTDAALTMPYINSGMYTRCRSNSIGGGTDEYEITANVLGVYTRTC